jgi:lipopolysaccharide heptosyltransferase II
MLPDYWRSVRRVLVMRLDNIGDVVMLSPSLRTLREALPQAEITLMASSGGSQVAPLLPWVDKVIVSRPVWQDISGAIPQSFEREMAQVERLREGGYDAAVIFTSFSQSPFPPAYVCYLAGIPIRIGQSKEFGGSLLSQSAMPLPDNWHQADRNLFLLEFVGFEVSDRHLSLHVPIPIQEAADQLLCQNDINPAQPFIVAAPGASCAARRYPPERFAAVIRQLAARTGLPIVVVGSEREQSLIDPILAANGNRDVVSLVGRTSVPELAALIRRASMVVANNSAPLHMADAFNRPMVILYSGTEYLSQWRPRRAPAVLLKRDTVCSPCYNFTCPYNLECLDIAPEEVVAEVCALLQGTNSYPAGLFVRQEIAL